MRVVATEASSPRGARCRRAVPVVLTVLLLSLAIVGLTAGSSDLAPTDAMRAIFGLGDSADAFIVQVLRLPRVVVATFAGACLALSGAIMQGLLRNPLASPDIVGVTGAASIFTVLAIGAAAAPFMLPVAAGTGAVAGMLFLYLLSRRTSASSMRLVLIGIGLQALTSAAVSLAVARIESNRLGAAEVWLAGSLHARNDLHMTVAVVGALIMVPVVFSLLDRLSALELGDDLATGIGVPVRGTRSALLVTSALLAGIAVAVAGPITFLALGAPHIARRLVGATSAIMMATAALVGAVMLLTADIIGQHLLADRAIPAGVITAALGGPYLLWLLHRTGRR